MADGEKRRKQYREEGGPIVLRKLIGEAGITQAELARSVDVSRASINLTVNYAWEPSTGPAKYRADIERFISGHKGAAAWLKENGLEVRDIWNPLEEGRDTYRAKGHGRRVRDGLTGAAMAKGDPDNYEQNTEVEMLSQQARKHFNLFRDPFIRDVNGPADIFMSEEHLFLKASIVEAARNSGFMAVVGEVGSGKTSIRRMVLDELKGDENFRLIFPRILNKEKINDAAIASAIVADLDPDARIKVSHEARARQVIKLLCDRKRAGATVCLMIEEAQDLTVNALKILKRVYEFEDPEDSYAKLLSIILIGQPELGRYFSEADYHNAREVTRRCQIAHIQGLNGDLARYLDFKLQRVGAKRKDVITDSAIEALGNYLTVKGPKRRAVSQAYPLTVNVYTVRAMNLAVELGEKKVTAEVMQTLWTEG